MKKCPACNKSGKAWRTIDLKGILIKGKCDRCGYNIDRTKHLRSISSK